MSLSTREGPRKPRRSSSVRNIAKSALWTFQPFSPHFSCFCGRKDIIIGLIEDKVRMFSLESSDVFPQKFRCFGPKRRHILHLLPCFRLFSRRNAEKTSSRWKKEFCKMVFIHCKTYKTAPKFTLIPGLWFVKIFEGFHAFLIRFSCGLKPAWKGVCNPLPPYGRCPSRLTFASDAVWRCKKTSGESFSAVSHFS